MSAGVAVPRPTGQTRMYVFSARCGTLIRGACLVLALAAHISPAKAAPAAAAPVLIGVAKADITPKLPIHLIGFANRTGESSEVAQRLHARAIAIGGGENRSVVVVAAEIAGITEEIGEAVAAALGQSHRLARADVAICTTHTHTGPAIRGFLPFSWNQPLTPEMLARVSAYTDELQKKLVGVARAALDDLQPARLAWGEGELAFAAQRRRVENGQWVGFGIIAEGPVDGALPVLQATDERGKVRALFLSYACHCTAVGGANAIHPDWAGEASAQIEAAHAGAVALVGIGCGGDANPVPRGSRDAAASLAAQVADEVARVLAGPLRGLGPVTQSQYRRLELSLDRAVGRTELEERAAKTNRTMDALAAKALLRELDEGRPPRTALPLPVQTWCFGEELAMIFLGGEVVSDYSLRLRRELVAGRVWVNAYANSVPSYIASKRMYSQGGYEVDASMPKYGWPTRLAIGTEDRIIGTVHALLPAVFKREREQ